MRRQLVTAALVLVAAVGLVACSGGGSTIPLPPTSAPPSFETTTEPTTVTVTATATATETATSTATATTTVEPPSTEAPPPPPSEEETYTPDPEPTLPSDNDLRTTTATAVTAVNAYWTGVFAGWDVTWHPPRLFNGDGFYDSDKGVSYDECGAWEAFNAGYCPASQTVSWDLQYLSAEESIGDGPVYATVAHEIGHHAQNRFHSDGEGLASPPRSDSVRTELQADCLGATALAQTVRDGYLSISDDDLDDVALVTEAIAGGDHGTAAQRIAAFNLGYHGDVESCLYNRGVSPSPGVI